MKGTTLGALGRIGVVVMISFSVSGIPSSVAKTPKVKGALEVVGDTAILKLPVRGFEALPLQEKLLAYHLYQAAVAGRDIYFDQTHRYHLAIREICEQIVLHPAKINKKVLVNVSTYLKRQFLNGGIYGKFTYAKYLPPKGLTFRKLKKAALQARKNGGTFRQFAALDLETQLDLLKDTIFDSDVEPFITRRAPKDGKDVLELSANNLYAPEIRLKDLKGLKEQHPLNSRISKRDDVVVEEVWRAGDPMRKIPPGMYAPAIKNIVGHLKEAIPYAGPKHAKALGLLVDYYETGHPVKFRLYNIAWLEYRKPTIDTINGFIEQYLDPREQKGSWEGTVFFINERTSGWLRKVADKAAYYEARMPIKPAYRNRGVKPIANMVEVLVEAGEAGPIGFAGVNLPNDQVIRQQFGSKNVLLWNGVEARSALGGDKVVREFYLPEDQELILKYRKEMSEILVGFHEALGHASGRKSSKLKGDPSEHLPGYYAWLEEERADLVALHHAWDPETFRIRKDWNEEAARALYKKYVAMEMLELAEIPPSVDTIEEAHLVGGLFAISYFMKRGIVEEVRRKISGKMKTFWTVRDENIPKMREAVAELLGELQRIKSEGDLPAIKKLAKEYGVGTYNKKLAAELCARKKPLGVPDHVAFVFPELSIVKKKSRPVDVRLTYPKSFLRQQMKWSGYSPKELASLK